MIYNYTPMPKYLTIKKSDIDGLGVFASEDIPVKKYLIIGPTHMIIYNDLYRLDFGGFINHSESPTCHLIEYNTINDIKLFSIIIDRPIMKGEELTLNYRDSFKILKMDMEINF